MKKNYIILTCIVSGLCLSFAACKKKDKEPVPETKTITTGALLSLTGDWSTLGITSEAALEIAVEDINKYLSGKNASFRMAAEVYDTKLDPALATQYITTAQGKGIRFVIGPQSSAEATAVKTFADGNDIIAISQGSTAGSLSIGGDNLFRFCPADDVEGPAMARTIYNDGIRGLITVARDDAGNKGLQTATGTAFSGLGGAVSALDPYGASTTDFAPLVAEIKNRILSLTNSHGQAGTGVYLASFEECVALFREAGNDPVLSSVNWYGGDGAVLSAALIQDAAAADFAISVKFFAPSFGLPEHTRSQWEPLSEKILSRTGIAPDAFALAAYDALWVVALSYEAANGNYELSNLKSGFILQADSYNGVTGATHLNEAGDRSSGSFDYWSVVKEGGTYKWKKTGQSE